MKKILFLSFLGLAFIACNNSTPSVSQQPMANANSVNQRESQTVASHSTEKSMPPPVQKSETKTKWTQSGSPIDTTEFDAEIEKAEKNLKSKESDESAKKELAEAYVKRGVALTDARQYASALGDYRKALKLDPENAEAKKWIDQIVGIYESINREYPKEGEEPPPLPFKKS
jgi:tetratricopeptide (TPR) repeat protein